jgi:hypothetical protein
MGRRTLGLVVGLALVVGASAWLTAQSKPSALEGAWVVQDITSPQPVTPPRNKPTGLIQFSGRNYSIVLVSNSVRPNLPEGGAAKATADQLNAIWGPLTANAGTFTVNGNTIRQTRLVAKNPAVMAAGNFQETTFTLNGDTLVLTDVRSNAGPVTNPTTIRLTRVK